MDETTDVANDAQLMCCVRYARDNNIHDDILFCRTLSTRTTSEEVFHSLSIYMRDKGIQWEKYVGLC
jgi:hypothetical protein